MVKYNADGQIGWVKTLVGSGSEYLYNIIALDDGSYLAVGEFSSDTVTIGDYTLEKIGESNNGIMIKCNEEGNIEELYNVEGAFKSAITTSDGGLVIVGKDDVGLIKYDENGDIEWQNKDLKSIQSLVETDEGAYLVTGTGYVVKLDRYGNIESKGESNITLSSIAKIDDENYIGLGSSNSYGYIVKEFMEKDIPTIRGMWVTKDDTSTYTTNSTTVDGGKILVERYSGTTIRNNISFTSRGEYDILVTKYDSNDNIEWVSSIGSTENDTIEGIKENEDETYSLRAKFNGSTVYIDNQELNNNSDSMDLKIAPLYGSSETTELEVKNIIKEFLVKIYINMKK